MSDLVREYREVGELHFEVGVPLSVNHMYYNTRRGGKRLTPKAEQYFAEARALINAAIHDQLWVTTPKGVWLYVDMVFYFKDRKVRDSHNTLKLLLDVMQGVVYENDYNVMPRIMGVELDRENPRVEVRVHPQTKELRKQYTSDMLVLS